LVRMRLVCYMRSSTQSHNTMRVFPMPWSFVVSEAEMRSHGSSLIRSLRRTIEILKAVVLAVAGVGAVVYACWDVHRLLLLGQNNRSLYVSSMADAVIGDGFC